MRSLDLDFDYGKPEIYVTIDVYAHINNYPYEEPTTAGGRTAGLGWTSVWGGKIFETP